MRKVEPTGRTACTEHRFAERLLESRARAGISQAALAIKAGVTPVQISRYERGDCEPRRAVIYRISDALNVSSEWLLDGERIGQPVHANKTVDISGVSTAALLSELTRRCA